MLTIKSLAVLFLMKTMTLTGFSPTFSLSNLQSISMASGEQPRIYTPLTDDELVEVLFDSHVSFFGHQPSPRRLAMAWAQVALENGHGKYTWNKNLGNVVPTSQTHGYYLTDSSVKYRSFESYEEAGIVYWSTVNNCDGLMSLFDSGDAPEVATMLKSCGYYEASVEQYAHSLRLLYVAGMKRNKDERESCYRPIH